MDIDLIWDQAQLRRAAAHWHDGQITWRGEKRVKGLSSFPAQAQSACRRGARSANYDVHLHIGEP